MLRSPTTGRARKRRGMILLVVVVMVALFAVIGLAFVLQTSSEAESSRIFREAKTNRLRESPPNPRSLFNRAIGDIIYDAPDDITGAFNAVRGHSLARSMFGFNYTAAPDPSGNGEFDPASYIGSNNVVPYNGYGTPNHILSFGPFAGTPNAMLVNYTCFPADGVVRDPERDGFRPINNPTDPAADLGNPPQGTFVAKNAPYTYPDLNNLFLAAVDAQGRVLTPSFHRPWLFNPSHALNDPSNPNWTSPQGKYLTLRPRPADHAMDPMTGQPLFPYPADATGDVKNLEGAPGGNDSIWIDMGFPVRTWKGKKYKPLFAFLIIDLDGRINLNVAGNHKSSTQTHVSNQGWGGWEVNPAHILTLNPGTALAELGSMLRGNGTVTGRYGRDDPVTAGVPQPTKYDGTTQAPAGSTPPFYGQADFDAADTTDPPMALPQPGEFTTFPNYQVASAARYGNGFAPERDHHPALYNPYLVTDSDPPAGSEFTDRAFKVAEVRNLNAKFNGDAASYSAVSELGRLAPTNLGADVPPGQPNPRFLMTTISNDLDRLGASPWVTSSADPAYGYSLPAGQIYPVGANPTPGQEGAIPPPASLPFPTPFPPESDFASNLEWRNLQVAGPGMIIPRTGVDLNRKLADYRADPNLPPSVANITPASYIAAVQDRQRFARDIYERLVVATGANRVSPTPEQGDALRWLAQLAVNIVDYIDNDDYVTPFVWNPVPSQSDPMVPADDPANPADYNLNFTPAAPDVIGNHVVFGTELPRLVLNEAYVQVNNDPADPKTGPPNGESATLPYHVNFWLELHNTFRYDPNVNSTEKQLTDLTLSDQGAARLVEPNGPNGAYPVYKVLITRPNDPATFNAPTNVLGAPDDPANVLMEVRDYTPAPAPATQPVLAGDEINLVRPMPNSTQYGGTLQQNQGFYVLGPAEDFPGNGSQATLRVQVQPADPTTGLPRNGLMYELPLQDATMAPLPIDPTRPEFQHNVLLRRLACPHLPPNDPTAPGFDPALPPNPYVTVDYLDNVPVQDGVEADANGVHTPTPIDQRHSFGRRQPYAAGPHIPMFPSGLTQQAPTTPLVNMPQHTLFTHNGDGAGGPGTTLDQPFEWLVHLDRQLISPIELLYVSCFKPHQLTHQFLLYDPSGTNPPQKHQHTAPWLTRPDTRLYRALEFLRTSNRTAGLGDGTRVPGKVNINTVWDPQVLLALVDAQPAGASGNHFDPSQIYNPGNPTDPATLWGKILQSRSPGLLNLANPTITPTDRPFIGPANPYYDLAGVSPATPLPSHFNPMSNGLEGTLFRRVDPAQPNLGSVFDVPDPAPPAPPLHPYLKNELLAKVYNNLTTRSNVFAVWCTIGYFEVVDSSVRPEKLGAELDVGGTTQRDKFFAIIDRTNLTIDPANPRRQGGKPIFFTADQPAPGSGLPVTVTIPGTYNPTTNSITGSYEGVQFTIGVGTQLVAGLGGTQETVTVTAVNSNPGPPPSATITFVTNLPHPNGFPLCTAQIGNPGPQPDFNYSSPPWNTVVRYFEQLN